MDSAIRMESCILTKPPFRICNVNLHSPHGWQDFNSAGRASSSRFKVRFRGIPKTGVEIDIRVHLILEFEVQIYRNNEKNLHSPYGWQDFDLAGRASSLGFKVHFRDYWPDYLQLSESELSWNSTYFIDF